jgi:PAS domain S-box-containing protein
VPDDAIPPAPSHAAAEPPPAGDALARELRSLRRALDRAGAAIFRTDREGRVTYVNERTCEIAGRSAEALLGRGWIDTIDPADREAMANAFTAEIRRGEPSAGELRVRRPDGSTLWVRGRWTPELDDEGAVVGYIGTMVEIDDVKRAQLELAAAQDRYRAFVRDSSDGVWRVELTAPIPVDLPVEEQVARIFGSAVLAEGNAALARVYGVPDVSHVLGQTLGELARLDGGFGRFITAFVESGYRAIDLDHQGLALDGTPRSLAISGHGVIESGALVRAWGIVRDVTEVRRVHRLLVRSQQHLELAQAVAQSGSWELDLDSGDMFRTVGARRLHGLPLDGPELPLSVWEGLVVADDRLRLFEAVAHALETTEETNVDYRITRPDGEVRHMQSRCKVVADGEGRRRLVGVMVDVTERRTAEASEREMQRRLLQAQKLESLGMLAGGIAHDFNNLLTSILGNASLGRWDTDEAHPARECFDDIEATARQAAELCRQLLAYAGRGQLALEQVHVGRMVRETTDLLRSAVARRADVIYALDDTAPPVEADPTQLRQIVMNLVLNAAEAMHEAGRGHITVRAYTREATLLDFVGAAVRGDVREGTHVVLEVEDDGVGMPPEVLARIFDPFFTTKFTGRGLGLAAVLGIVKGHRGAMFVDTEPGRGSCFRLWLPATTAEPETTTAIDRAAESARFAGTGVIIVVDDERPVRAVVARMIAALGFAALEAGSGREALELARRHRAQLRVVIIDQTMPEMGGEALAAALRAEGCRARLIAMSGLQIEAPPGAVDPFAVRLAKPFTVERLADALRDVMG